MTARPQHGDATSAVPDIANLGLVRPPLVYLTSLVSGVVIHLATPLRFLPETLVVPLGVPLTAVAIALFSCSVAKFRAAGTPVPARKPTTVIVRTARIASAGTRSIWRSPCSSSVSRSGSTAHGCWLHSSGRWRLSTLLSYRKKSSTWKGSSVSSTWTIWRPCAGGCKLPKERHGD